MTEAWHESFAERLDDGYAEQVTAWADVPLAPCPNPYRDGTCRHMTCGRCGQHTNNNTQGHWWKYCKVTKGMREFHFCCPGDCELEAKGTADA